MKKILIGLLALFSPALAFAQSSTIALPNNFNDNILAQAQNLLQSNSIGGYAAMIIGVLLATLIIDIIIGAIRK